MKKKLFLVPVVMCAMGLVSGLVACGGTTGNSTSQKANQSIKITAEGNKTQLTLGESVQLSASVEGVEWSLEKEGIVTISDTGLVNSVAAGKVTVFAKKKGSKTVNN